jgi:hypothetical protein
MSGEDAHAGLIDKACRWLMSMQVAGDAADPLAFGGYLSIDPGDRAFYRTRPLLHAWASQFATRALIHRLQGLAGSLSLERMMEDWC